MFIWFILCIIGIIIFAISSEADREQIAEGCLTGIIGLVIVIVISAFCFKIHPILGIIAFVIGLRALGRNK